MNMCGGGRTAGRSAESRNLPDILHLLDINIKRKVRFTKDTILRSLSSLPNMIKNKTKKITLIHKDQHTLRSHQKKKSAKKKARKKLTLMLNIWNERNRKYFNLSLCRWLFFKNCTKTYTNPVKT